MAHAGQDGIFDWELLQGTTANTIDDLFAITVLKGDKGDRIGRNSKSVLDESQLVYLTDSKKIIRPPNVWIWFGGAIKVHADLRGENISLADKKYYLSLDSDGYSTNTNKQTEAGTISEGGPLPEIDEKGFCYTDEILNAADEFWGCQKYDDQNVTEWTEHIMDKEFYCDKSYIEATEDNSIAVCFLPMEHRWINNWQVKVIDLSVGDAVATSKQGNPCYLFVGGDCHVTDTETETNHAFNKWDCKKLTKASYTLTNTGTEKFRACLIYKDV